MATAWSSAPPRFLPPPATATFPVSKAASPPGKRPGFELFSGVNVPSKAFGEHIEHACHTPSVSAEELDGLMRSGTDMVVVDSRPFDEFQRVSIPSATNVPGAELVLRIHDIAPSPETLVVVNCAGRTRSIIGAQSLINAGLPNKVVALRNGTMGWTLAGLMPDSGKTKRYTEPSADGLAWAKAAAERVGKKLRRHAHRRARRWRASAPIRRARSMCSTCATRRTTPPAICPAPSTRPAASLSRPPTNMPRTLGARLVLVDDREVRAVMTASWLKQMGWRDVFVLAASGSEKGRPPAPVLGPAPPRTAPSRPKELSELVAKDRVTVVDLSLSPAYRKGHIPGAWFAIRTRLAAGAGENPDERRAGADLGGRRAGRPRRRRDPRRRPAICAAATPPGRRPASRSPPKPRMADEPLDYWPKPYERTGNTTDAMNEYLSWEVDLLPRIERDGTTRFATPT